MQSLFVKICIVSRIQVGPGAPDGPPFSRSLQNGGRRKSHDGAGRVNVQRCGIIVPIREFVYSLQIISNAFGPWRVAVCPDDPNVLPAPDRRPTGLQMRLNGILRDGQTAILQLKYELNEDSTT